MSSNKVRKSSGQRGKRSLRSKESRVFRSGSGERGAVVSRLARDAYDGQGPPDVAHVTLKWALHASTDVATSFAISALSANSVFDCGVSAAATNAVFFSAYMALYSRFYVLSSRIRVRASHGSDTTGVGSTATSSTIGVFPSLGTSAAASLAAAEAQSGARFVTFDVGGMKTVVQHCSPAQISGLSRAQYVADPLNHGNSSTAPVTAVYWNLFSQSSAAQVGLNIEYDITIEYDVVFLRRQSPNISFETALLELCKERDRQLVLDRLANEAKQKRGEGALVFPSESKDDGKFPNDPPSQWVRCEPPTPPGKPRAPVLVNTSDKLARRTA